MAASEAGCAPESLSDGSILDQQPASLHLAEVITVVTGLPRSGTSLMMQMLAAGGMPVLTDGQRQADADNPHGYFESELVKRLPSDPSWLVNAKGKAVKMVAHLVPFLPLEYPYRVILTQRDLAEVLVSQKKMLLHHNEAGALLDEHRLKEVFAQQLEQVKAWLRCKQVRTLEVAYLDCVQTARTVAERVNHFLGGHLSVEAMAAAVDLSLYRNRLDDKRNSPLRGQDSKSILA